MTVTATKPTLSAAEFEAIRARTPDISSPPRRQPMTRLALDVAMLILDRDMLLSDLTAEVARHNALAERLHAAFPSAAPEAITLPGDETPSVHASPHGFDYLSHRAVLEMLEHDIADGNRFGAEGLTEAMEDRGRLLRARAVTARRLLEVQEATIELYYTCAAHGVEVGR